MDPFASLPHRRFNLLAGEWVLVSPHRAKRPWKGQTESLPKVVLPEYLPDCYLCPGNRRAGEKTNPPYDSVFVFRNDFSALNEEWEAGRSDGNEADCFRAEPVSGECRVVCFSPKHNLTLQMMDLDAIARVVATWREQTRELEERFLYVQIFENKGEMMGCSNPHPHAQIWAGDFVPNLVAKEIETQRLYLAEHGVPLLEHYSLRELEEGSRVVAENAGWLAVVPYWAVWPYEVLLVPLFEIQSLKELDDSRSRQLASVMKSVLTRYDNLFRVSFPYSMGWHQAPAEGIADGSFRLHAHFYPPLLRSATVKKFMVGYELLAEPQRDLLPETAARTLAGLPSARIF